MTSEGVRLMLIRNKGAWAIRASQTLAFITNVITGNFTLIFLNICSYTTTTRYFEQGGENDFS